MVRIVNGQVVDSATAVQKRLRALGHLGVIGSWKPDVLADLAEYL